LCHIVHTFSIFQDRRKAVELCVNRFDADTKEAFIDLYSKVDATIKPATTAPVYDEALNSADPLQSIIDEAKRDMI
jgi:hypothetical protein